jgi:hypothetical protein
MNSVDQAVANQLANIETRSGRSLAELEAFVKASGLDKHGAIRDLLMQEFGLGHGDANTLTHHVRRSDGASVAADRGLGAEEALDEIYSGPKAGLRPIHDALMAAVQGFGDAFEIAPKKGYVSLRRKKQFAMIGPATKTQVELGLNAKDLPAGRLSVVPAGGMCNFKLRLDGVEAVDTEIIGWLRQAFDAAG